MLGYCTECQKLLPIIMRRYDVAKRRGAYYPVEHDASGERCPGVRKELP